MFKTKRRVEALERELEREIDRLAERYWELSHRHSRLLQHLGLTEHKVLEHMVIKQAEGREESE